MITIENRAVRLAVAQDASTIIIEDKRRRLSWRLDTSYRRCCPEGGDSPGLLPPGRAERRGDAIVVLHAFGDASLEYTWTLGDDFAEVALSGDAPLSQAALPGPFVPLEGCWELAVPVHQGCLLQPSGQTWETNVGHGGHAWFSMAMGAVLAPAGSLVVSHASGANWRAVYGETAAGPFMFFQHVRCPVDGWKDARVQFHPCDATLTSACKRYRQIVRQRGDFRSWEEKIQAKPILKNLFGALFAFVGYNKTDQIDYVASARRLKAHGFERIFFYPLRMCHYSLAFEMGGDEPTWHSDEDLQALHALGDVYLAPWAWVYEGLDDGSADMDRIYRHQDGRRVPGWRMDGNFWYQVCPPYQIEHMRRRLAIDMAAMDWLHFDVSANVPSKPCTRPDHALHGSRPIGALEDMAWTRRLLSPETVGDRIVSSEGFSDYHASSYDVGTTKAMPLDGHGGLRMPVPMTMLVFHDSCIHDWWELQNYNAVAGWPVSECPHQMGRRGSGEPRLKAAIDALYGCPPNLFPFGKQYAWVDKPCGDTYSFLVRLDDAPVQEAIQAALPVARLHGRIGQCEMTDFDFLSDDRFVQATTFSNGTRIVSNLSCESRDVESIGRMAAHSWTEIE